MECPSCLLRYSSTKRLPHIIQCGHSICSLCLPQSVNCPVCSSSFLKNSKINYSLMEVAQRDQSSIDKFIKVCFIGSSGVGKTSLIRMLTNHEYSNDVASTVGYDFTFDDRVISGYRVRYQFWDSAGQERYQAISPIHYKNAHIIVIVYDVTADPEKNKIFYWIGQVQKHAPKQVKIMLVGNKTDLLDGKISKPLEKEVWQSVKEQAIELKEISCKGGIGKENLWEGLSDFFKNRESSMKKEEININPRKSKGLQFLQFKKIPLKKQQRKKEYCC